MPSEVAWAVLNEKSGRLVISATDREHRTLSDAIPWPQPARRIALNARLLDVPCKEIEGVEWVEEMVAARGPDVLHEMGGLGLPGGRIHCALRGKAVQSSLTTEVNVGVDDTVIDVDVHYAAEFLDETRPDRLVLKTKLILRDQVPLFVEVGMRDDPMRTVLLELRAEAQFMDGTLCKNWREYESPEDVPTAEEIAAFDDETRQARWFVPPTFLSLPEDEWPRDEAAASDAEQADARLIWRDAPKEISEKGRVVDVSRLLLDSGLELSPDGWAIYDPRSSILAIKDRKEVRELADQLVNNTIGPCYPHPIRVTVSMVQGRADEVRRVSRLSWTGHPGTRGYVELGLLGDHERMQRGAWMELNPSVGATAEVVELALASDMTAGDRRHRFLHSFVLASGRPIVVPLSAEDGTRFELVVEATSIDARGRSYESRFDPLTEE